MAYIAPLKEGIQKSKLQTRNMLLRKMLLTSLDEKRLYSVDLNRYKYVIVPKIIRLLGY